jgi:hypothetical protein
MRSIDRFMPCYNQLHVIIDESDMLALGAWMDVDEPNVFVHPLTAPDSLSHLSGYVYQGIAGLWADNYTQNANSTADYVMLMDVDVVLGAPVTCNSLFDDRRRLYQAGMPLKHQQQLVSIIADTVGPWEWSYMIFFPFTVPMSVFPRMQSHVTKFMGFNDDQFDDAMASWAAKQDNAELTFCGYCMLGAYMDMYESERVNAHCPLQGEHQGTDCANWAFVGTHWGWRPCGYAESCTHGASDSIRRENVGELSQRTSKKYGIKAWEYIEKISVDGKCFMYYMNTGEMLQGCTEEQSLHVPRRPSLPKEFAANFQS